MHFRRAAIALLAATTLAACGGAPSSPKALALERSEKAFEQVGIDETRQDVTALVAAATRLGARLATRDTRAGSTAVPSWSVLSLLGMLRAGAEGSTAAQLDGAGLGAAKDLPARWPRSPARPRSGRATPARCRLPRRPRRRCSSPRWRC
ncbi:hypothetical protein [Tsukamurella sp. PLM1]|uniref:hypothetical protein n=1 Tax=Tsukamurella sp. PLM1 TaxID=2929795 RepID=UPI0020504347|nr:hypothetical protein [Tsukamurella sp. PLM1]BDH58867.1 hypothetical protein MTP03_38060 [Tsukamurella sp. PLM1]